MGLRDGFPIALGYFAVSFGFGILAISYGLSWYEALFISMFNLTSAGQLAAVPLLATGGSLFELAATQVVINSRYALMSVALSQRLGKSVKFIDRFPIGFANTDENFAVAIGKGQPLGRKYLYGLILTPYFGWTLGTLIGALAGNILPELVVTALSVSFYAMFIAIVVPLAKKSVPVLLCALSSVGVSCLFAYAPGFNKVPSGFVIVIAAVVVSSFFALVAPISDEKEEDTV